MTPGLTSVGSFFSGGGGSDLGAIAAGLTPLFGVEIDEDIAAVYSDNIGPHILCEPIQCVNMRKLPAVDVLLASPPCQSFSVARSKNLAARDDADLGIHILDYVAIHRPRLVVIENVPGYGKSAALGAIVSGMARAGYSVNVSVLNAADFGVPQTRKRLIVRAVLGGAVPRLTPTHRDPKLPSGGGLFGDDSPAWNGWYNAISDIIHTLPESAFAPWQLKRLPAELFESTFFGNQVGTDSEMGRRTTLNKRAGVPPALTVAAHHRTVENYRAFLVEGDAAGDRPPTCRTSAEPSFTLKDGSGGGRVHRAFLVGGANTSDVQSAPGVGVSACDEPTLCVATNAGQWRAFLCGVQGEGGELARDGVPPSPTITTAHDAAKYRAWLVSDQSSHAGEGVGLRQADAPASTVRTNETGGSGPKALLVDSQNKGSIDGGQGSIDGGRGMARAWLEQGRVVAMSIEALGRFQSFPDAFRWPASKSLAAKICGNSVPPLMMQRILEAHR